MGYLQDRDGRIAGFEETLELCEQDVILSHAIWQTGARTRYYQYKNGTSWKRQLWSRIRKDRIGLTWIRRGCCHVNQDNIFVTRERSLDAVRRMKTAYPQSRVAVLHFASGTNPGGGVIRGGVGQEESLCRCSTLYPCLQQHKVRKTFYDRHQRTGDPYYSDTCVYLPGIIGIRDDVLGGGVLREQDRYMFDVITCAPPNVRIRRWDEEHKNLMKPLEKPENIENMKRFAKDNNVTFVFECVDMKHDPHIIEYPESNLYLLDIVYNQINYAKYDYDAMCDTAHRFGLTPKKKACELATWQEFYDWYYDILEDDYEYNGRVIEGFVIEDSAGYMTKLKLAYYNFWKFMRTISYEAIRNGYIKKTSALTTPLANEYYAWVRKLHDTEDPANVPRDICTLRRWFYNDMKQAEGDSLI